MRFIIKKYIARFTAGALLVIKAKNNKINDIIISFGISFNFFKKNDNTKRITVICVPDTASKCDVPLF